MDSGSNELRRLIYISHAVHPFNAQALDKLLAGARAFNTTIGVSGLLLYHDGSFLQVLEGSEASLAKVMQKVRADARHRGVIVMAAARAERRAFADWSMGYVPTERLSGAQRDGFLNLTSFAMNREPANTGDREVRIQVEAFLSTFREFEAA